MRNKVKFISWLFFQESEIAKVQALKTNLKSGNLGEESEELAKLLAENSKLKFRLEVLNRVRKYF